MLAYSKIAFIIMGALAIFSCKREETYVYAVNTETVAEAGVKKPNVKTNTEFISITYTDIFGATIATSKLSEMQNGYLAFGDKGILEDLIIRDLLNQNAKQIPATIGSDIKTFVVDAYKKIYNRMPNEYEIFYLEDLLKKNSGISAEMFYYALMTSNEYRQF